MFDFFENVDFRKGNIVKEFVFRRIHKYFHKCYSEFFSWLYSKHKWSQCKILFVSCFSKRNSSSSITYIIEEIHLNNAISSFTISLAFQISSCNYLKVIFFNNYIYYKFWGRKYFCSFLCMWIIFFLPTKKIYSLKLRYL